MFAGFNLEVKRDFKEFYSIGQEKYKDMEKEVRKELNKYLGVNGKIDGTKIQNDWFPSIKADVFISHSHKDEEIAIGLAGWLSQKFGLESFIDSCVWGYANDLLKQIDDEYCRNGDGNTYNYHDRNNSTSHVHMMLSTSLYKMIDKTECIFLLSTSNSVQANIVNSSENIIKTQTESPWIYSEIIGINLIRKKKLSEYRSDIIRKGFTKFANESVGTLEVTYDIDLSKLDNINDDHIDLWEDKRNEEGYKLDYLYEIVRPDIFSKHLMIEKGDLGFGRYGNDVNRNNS